MDFLDTLTDRNAAFARNDFAADLTMMPSTGTIVVGCVDPRVDPALVLGLAQGEAAVIRNVGGRVDEHLIDTLGVLRVVAQAAGRPGGVRNLVLLHHSDCGIIGCYHQAPDLLARHLGVGRDALDTMHVTDPRKAVAHDIAALRANEQLADGTIVTGLVYDVATGLIETVVPPGPLRPATS
jgi:carbonic anhydrase